MVPARVLVDLERTRHLQSGLGYYCQCLEEGLRALSLPYHLCYYRPRRSGEADVQAYHFIHKFMHRSAQNYDLVHITHQQQTYFPSRLRGKCIVTLHDLNFLFEPLSPRRYKRELEKAQHNLNRADCIVSISHFVQATLLEHQDLFDLKPDVRLEVIHNGIHLSTDLTEDLSTIPLSIQKLSQRPYLLCIGFLSEKKQQGLLLEPLNLLPDDMELVLVYSSARVEYLQALQADIRRLGLERRVHLLHRISNKTKAYLLAHCEALVQPSLAEGFGIPPIEAMAFGKPVILNPVTAMPEIGGEMAYYFDSLEAEAMAQTIRSALADYKEHSGRAEAIRQWAARYDYRRMAREYAALYSDLLR